MVGECPTELTTPRCRLRPVTADDAEPLHELWSSPGVRRFLWDGEIIPMARTRAAIEQNERMFEEQTFGLWGARSPGSRNLVGFGGLWHFRDPPDLELLYGVAERLWGQGYAGEIAQAVLTYCFDSSNRPVVRASTDVANSSSVRVLEKLGFRSCAAARSAAWQRVFYEIRPGGGERRYPKPDDVPFNTKDTKETRCKHWRCASKPQLIRTRHRRARTLHESAA